MTAPVIECPINVTVGTNTLCTYVGVIGTATATDNCDNEVAITSNKPGAFPLGVTTVTWTATDDAGNTSTCSQTVTVTDDDAPVITCPANITVTMPSGVCFATIDIMANPATATDNCGTATVLPPVRTLNGQLVPINAAFPVGTTTTITWMAIDANLNFTVCVQTVTVNGDLTVTLSCSPTITLPNDPGLCSRVVNEALFVNPIATGCAVVTFSKQRSDNLSFSAPFPVGTTTITWNAISGGNVVASCAQLVVIEDKENPVITCPANITVGTDPGVCSALITVPNPTRSDNCGVTKLTWTMAGATTASSPADGINNVNTATFNGGVTTVTYTAYDAAGNSATCSFTVTVNDDEDPIITCPGDQTVSCASEDHLMQLIIPDLLILVVLPAIIAVRQQ